MPEGPSSGQCQREPGALSGVLGGAARPGPGGVARSPASRPLCVCGGGGRVAGGSDPGSRGPGASTGGSGRGGECQPASPTGCGSRSLCCWSPGETFPGGEPGPPNSQPPPPGEPAVWSDPFPRPGPAAVHGRPVSSLQAEPAAPTPIPTQTAGQGKGNRGVLPPACPAWTRTHTRSTSCSQTGSGSCGGSASPAGLRPPSGGPYGSPLPPTTPQLWPCSLSVPGA